MKAIQIQAHGGPEVLQLVDLPTPSPGPDEVRIGNRAIGVNYIDIYFREGVYPTTCPSGLGVEGAGVIEAVGDRVDRFKPGDRVGYAARRLGGYAEAHVLSANDVVHLPDDITFEIAAAGLLKGMTTEFLVRRCYPLKRGEACLVWAAAGGVGSILTQWCHAIGGEVIGIVGSDAKMELARAGGCDHVLNHKTEDITARVREITGGAGVRVSYDGVGKASFETSLNSLGRRGMLVSYGNASGAVPPVEPLALSRAGSLYLTRPTMFDYVATVEELDDSAAATFEMIRSGKVRIDIGLTLPLAEARRAQEVLAASETTGSTILIP